MDVEIQCPYCGEIIGLWVDLYGGLGQRYVEDCAVCCRPMQVEVAIDPEGDPAVVVARLDA